MVVLYFGANNEYKGTEGKNIKVIENLEELEITALRHNSVTAKKLIGANNLKDSQIKLLYRISTRWSELPTEMMDFEFKCSNLLRLYSAFLQDNKIRTVLMGTAVPHHVDSMIFDFACDINQILRIYPNLTNLSDKSYLLLKQIGTSSKRSPYNLKSFKKSNLAKSDIEQNINRLRDFRPPTTSTQSTSWKKSATLAILYILIKGLKEKFISTKRPVIFPNRFLVTAQIRSIFNQLVYLRAYKKYQVKLPNNPNKQVIFFANYQPEASTLPLGEEYFNQLNAIEKLGVHFKSLEKFYKEHPTTQHFLESFIGVTRVGFTRSKFYFEIIKKNNFQFLDISTPNVLSEKGLNNKLVCTITGTIALQRSLAGLRTIVFGKHWFNKTPGIIGWEDFLALKEKEQERYFITTPDKKLEEKAKAYIQKLSNQSMITLNLSAGRSSSDRGANNLNSELKNLLELLAQN